MPVEFMTVSIQIYFKKRRENHQQRESAVLGRNVTFWLLSSRPKSFLCLNLERAQKKESDPSTIGQFPSCQLS